MFYMLTCERKSVHCHIKPVRGVAKTIKGEMKKVGFSKILNLSNYHYYYLKGSVAFDKSESGIL